MSFSTIVAYTIKPSKSDSSSYKNILRIPLLENHMSNEYSD